MPHVSTRQIDDLLHPLDVPVTPEQDDLASALKERVHIVIVVRWALIATAAATAVIGGLSHSLMEPSLRLGSFVPPLVGLVIWIVCNTTFHLFYRRFYAARSFLYGQIVVDLLVSIPFLHFSGGIFSYGWIQYPAVVLESALILPSRRDPWLAAGFACLLAVGFAVTEFVGWVTPAPQELYTAAAARHLPSILDRIPWTLGVTLMAAYLGTYLMSTVREREHRLHQAALRDSLTGLYNRVHFARRLQSEVERAKRYGGTPSVIMADLDGFKRVNDTRGHVEGDRVLVTVGKLILSSVRRSDAEPAYDIDVPFRYGGDEFAIIVPGSAPMPSDAQGSPSITPSAGAILAERLRGAVADAMTEYGVTLSAGVATYPLHGVQADELVRSADGYLYEAKRLGGNCVVQGDTNPAERPTR